MTLLDAVVVGSGPNGLAAAVTLARAGLRVRVLEAQPTVGGGARTLSSSAMGFTLPDAGPVAPGVAPAAGADPSIEAAATRRDLLFDLCSAVHPMAWASPFFSAFDLPARGVELRVPEVSYAQPLDGGRAALAFHDLDRTVAGLGPDGPAWRALIGTLAGSWEHVAALVLGDKRTLTGMTGTLGVPRPSPAHGEAARHGPTVAGVRAALRYGTGLLELGTGRDVRRFSGDLAPALLAGVAAHGIAPVPSAAAAGAALLLAALAHGPGGWPLPVGGSGAISAALVADLLAHGGEIETDRPVRTGRDLPPARAYLFDTAPGAVAQILRGRLGRGQRRALGAFRHGNGVAKVDFVLSGPVPWAAPGVELAGTVHLGGTRTEVAAAEAAVARGHHAERPVALLSDPAVTDPAREVGGLRPLWTYAHVPAFSSRDVTEEVTAQIERFAPGFRDLVVAARCTPADRIADHNANYVGGDIAAGAATLGRYIGLPSAAGRWDPYAGGAEGVYLCSASVPPGPGVHGMGGWHAARRALVREFDVRSAPSLAPTPGVLHSHPESANNGLALSDRE